MILGYKREVDILIFDCDGVLFDSSRANWEYYNKICLLAGRPPINPNEFKYVHMHTAEESIKYLFEGYPGLLENALMVARDLSYSQFIKYMKFDPSLPTILQRLKQLGFILAISTNRSTTMPLLRKTFGLERWFDFICSAMDVRRPKPDPEGVYKILNHFSLSTQKAIYIGDSIVDQIVSERAGIPLVAFRNPALKAMFHVKHFRELAYILTSCYR